LGKGEGARHGHADLAGRIVSSPKSTDPHDGVDADPVAVQRVAPLVGLVLFQFDAVAGAMWRGRWLVPSILGVATLLLIGVAFATSGFDAVHPWPNQVACNPDLDTGAAWWVSIDESLDPWRSQGFPDPANAGYEVAGIRRRCLDRVRAVAAVPPPLISAAGLLLIRLARHAG